jgi:DNA repair protein REV1
VQDLRQLIVHNGGIFQPYLTKKALVYVFILLQVSRFTLQSPLYNRTHIVTCSLTPAKVREFKHMKVVRPEWLVDSVEIGYLMPWTNYIYKHNQESETTTGRSQMSLTDHQAQPSASHNPPKTSKPSFLSVQKKPPAADPLYTTDPLTKADAARVPGYAADKSNPNAQRVMADPEWRKAHTSISSDFIEGYYKNSRLHHLSTWKAELKNLVQEAQERAESASNSGQTTKVASDFREEDAGSKLSMRGSELVMKSPTSKSKWKGKAKAVEDDERVIMHCDFDCFFVAAGLVSRPELKGKPVIVCHSQGNQGSGSSTSEIASSSYEARKFGIKNGMRCVLHYGSFFLRTVV